MPNIMINNSCNLKCEYCFAEDCKIVPKEMTVEDFKTALDFCSEGNSYIGIIGGEPTIHSNFKEIINIVQDDCRFTKACLFTNGVFLDKHLELFLREDNKFSMLINLNHPTVGGVSETAYEMSVKNIEKLHDNGIAENISLGINIYKKDQETDYILDLVEKFNIRKLRISVAAPNTAEKRKKNQFEYYGEIKETVIKVAEKCAEIGCQFGVDCSFFPPCIYTEEDRARLMKASLIMEMKGFEGFREHIETQECAPVIDIMPDLKMVRCFGTSCMKELTMGQVDNLEEASRYFSHRIDGILYYQRDAKCGDCKKHLLGACNGGCLGFQAT